MIVKRIEFRNINSYGNKTQVIDFESNGTGSLILLEGDNGTGKSTIKQVIEFATFRKARGKNGHKLSVNELPNRKNGAMYTGIFFENNNGDDIVMKSYVKPNKFEMTVNGVDFVEDFKRMTEQEREVLIGYSYDVFKSFISINYNDFKDFITLSREDKDSMLDKLLNITPINEINSIITELSRSVRERISSTESIIRANDTLVKVYDEAVAKAELNDTMVTTKRMTEIKDSMLSIKPIYDGLTSDNVTIGEQMLKLRESITGSNNRIDGHRNTISSLKSELGILLDRKTHYDAGTCPVCDSDLHDGSHECNITGINTSVERLRNDIVTTESSIEELKNDMIGKRTEYTTLDNKQRSNDREINRLRGELSTMKREYDELNSKSSVVKPQFNEEAVALAKIDNTVKNGELTELRSLLSIYNELLSTMSVKKIRTGAIGDMMVPINKNLKEFLGKLESKYSVVLDENFDARVLENNFNDINPETISRGEDKKINLAIALSYMGVILDNYKTNILFLDEILDGTDVNNVTLGIQLLKDIAVSRGLNVIVVHHGGVGRNDLFDRVITTVYDGFSDIIITDK